jgi:hypothetical protein
VTGFGSTVDCGVLWVARAGVGSGYTLEVVAARVAENVAELRVEGGIPVDVTTVVTVLPQARVLEVTVEAGRSTLARTAPPFSG